MKLSDYEENEPRGSGSFPIQYYYVDEKHPRYVMRLLSTANLSLSRS